MVFKPLSYRDVHVAAAIIQATVQRDAAGRATSLQIASAVDAGQKAHRQKGAYLLRTNCEETDPAQLWFWYIQLTQTETAFRTCWCVSSRWRCGARSSNGCAPRAWAPARDNSSSNSPE